MSTQTQLLKGVLEGCILAMVARRSIYGYELAVLLQQNGLEVSEGSIYPVLLRLQREKLIKGDMKKSPSGPNRKYYELTKEGKCALAAFKESWSMLKAPVDHLLETEESR
ncbi:PadR family transcriptional regulator [Bacillus sp. FSL W7-1360]